MTDHLPTFRRWANKSKRTALSLGQFQRTTFVAFGLQLIFLVLVAATIAYQRGSAALAPLFDPLSISIIYGGTIILTVAHAAFFRGRLPKAVIPFARNAALVLGALGSLTSMYLLFGSIVDVELFPRLVSRSLGGLFHGLLIAGVLLAPFEIQDGTITWIRLLQRLAIGLSGVVIVGVYIVFFKALTPEIRWGKGTDESLPSGETFSQFKLPVPVGEVTAGSTAGSFEDGGCPTGESSIYLRTRQRFALGTELFTSDNAPIVLRSSSSYTNNTFHYQASLPSSIEVPTGDWIYSSRRNPEGVVSEITLETTGCFGACPVYKLTLRREGSVTYEGKSFVDHQGTLSGRLSRPDFLRLELLLFGHEYFQLARNFDTSATDSEAVITSAVIGGRRKRIRNYANSGPFALWAIESAIEGLARKNVLKL